MPDNTDLLLPKTNTLSQGKPFFWLFSIRVPETPEPKAYRLTSHGVSVQFGQDEQGNTLVWQPFEISFDAIKQSSDGSLPILSITIKDPRGTILRAIESYDYLLGQTVTMILVHSEMLSVSNAKKSFDLTIVGFSMTDEGGASFAMSSEGLYNSYIPSRLVTSDSCINEYGGPVCLFDILGLDPGQAVLGRCDKTRDECRKRGVVELAASRPVIHPKQFLAAPGAPRVL